MKLITFGRHSLLLLTFASLLQPTPAKGISVEDIKTIGIGTLCGGAIATCLRDTIASNEAVKNVAHTINMSPQDLVLSAFYASVLAGTGSFVQSPVIKTGLYVSAALPLIAGACMQRKVCDWIGKLPFVRDFAKPLSKHPWLTIVSCPNKDKCHGFCEQCKVQRLYQSTGLGALLGLVGVAYIHKLDQEGYFSVEGRHTNTQSNNNQSNRNNIVVSDEPDEETARLFEGYRRRAGNINDPHNLIIRNNPGFCVVCLEDHPIRIRTCFAHNGNGEVHGLCPRGILGHFQRVGVFGWQVEDTCPTCRRNDGIGQAARAVAQQFEPHFNSDNR